MTYFSLSAPGVNLRNFYEPSRIYRDLSLPITFVLCYVFRRFHNFIAALILLQKVGYLYLFYIFFLIKINRFNSDRVICKFHTYSVNSLDIGTLCSESISLELFPTLLMLYILKIFEKHCFTILNISGLNFVLVLQYSKTHS